eukprot:gene13274-17787_t
MLLLNAINIIFHLYLYFDGCYATPKSSPNWELIIPSNGVKFAGRNAHASCVFKGKIWVTGGKCDQFTEYDLLFSYKRADVWYTDDGVLWTQVVKLLGDFYAQNNDVQQPGDHAPWYARYGHTLDAIDIDNDNEDDLMILTGGYASSPSNDVWVTPDGINWIYTGLAPWSPRAWHSTTIFKKKLWLMGGTPLNNEVWYLDSVVYDDTRITPLTRSLYNNYTYKLTWHKIEMETPWSPRVGMSVVSQWYFNTSAGETMHNSTERMVLVGGYGGWLATDTRYDGFYCRADSWESYNGYNWTLLNPKNSIGGRAWFGMIVRHGTNSSMEILYNTTSQENERRKRLGIKSKPPKIYLFGGGYTGFSTNSKRRVTKMVGLADAYFSHDGATWTKISYEEGGADGATLKYFSSQEWAETTVDTKTQYIGLWGHTVVSYNATSGGKYPGDLYLLGGDHTGSGDFSSNVYRSLDGMGCDINGVICGGATDADGNP